MRDARGRLLRREARERELKVFNEACASELSVAFRTLCDECTEQSDLRTMMQLNSAHKQTARTAARKTAVEGNNTSISQRQSRFFKFCEMPTPGMPYPTCSNFALKNGRYCGDHMCCHFAKNKSLQEADRLRNQHALVKAVQGIAKINQFSQVHRVRRSKTFFRLCFETICGTHTAPQ